MEHLLYWASSTFSDHHREVPLARRIDATISTRRDTLGGATMTTKETSLADDVPHTAVDQVVCPVARTAEIVSGKWTLLIIRDLTTGTQRFSELDRPVRRIHAVP